MGTTQHHFKFETPTETIPVAQKESFHATFVYTKITFNKKRDMGDKNNQVV